MKQLFVSYSRANKAAVDELVRQFPRLGYQGWRDAELHGGQSWWEEILRQIAECDAFVTIVSRESLNSVACQRELEWAEALGKPVLPVAVEETQHLLPALPRVLATLQIVDWTEPGLEAAIELAGALNALPPAPPQPEISPQHPPAPLSYLTDLGELVKSESLTHEQQRQIVNQLQPALRSADPEERQGGQFLLDRFSRRVDLYADVDRMLSQLGVEAQTTGTPTVVPPSRLTDVSDEAPAQHIADLQEKLRHHARAADWHAVINVSDELAALSPVAADPDGLATRARDALRNETEVTEDDKRYARGRAAEDAEELSIHRQPLFSFEATPAYALAWDPSGERIAIATDSTWAYVDDLIADEQHPENAALKLNLALQTGELSCTATSVAFDRSGARIATGSQQHQARIWDASSGEQLLELPHTATVWSVAFSPDGTRLATGSDDNAASIWDTSTGQKLLQLPHDGPVWSVAFSPDGTRVATASDDKKARVWNMGSGKLLFVFEHADAVNSVAFGSDGIRLATGSADNAASIWDSQTAQHLVALPHGDSVSSVAFSPDGALLATGCQDGFARIWDASAAELLLESRCAVSVPAVAFTPDGRYLAAVGGIVVRLWRVADLP